MKKILVIIATVAMLAMSIFAGDDAAQKVNAYYYAAYADTSVVASKLKGAGFDVIATYSPTQNSETLVITNSALKAATSKPGRGFAAVLRVLVDKENKRVAVTNPVYFGKAFLQDDYSDTAAQNLTEALKGALGTLTPSPDAYEADGLSGYHFMVAMPYYEDTYDLAEGKNEALAAKIEAHTVLFKLPLGEGRTLYGYDLSKETNGFVEKIGTQNAEILPYMVLIEDGKAKALHAKYYIAISYPLLTMGEFMTIVTTPGEIEKELKSAFK